MPKRLEVYKCALCGNVVEVATGGAGELVCCGQPMRSLKENTSDGAKEKHVPVMVEFKGGTLVKIGSVAHPMEPDHYIEWVEIINGDYVNRLYLKPGDKPEAVFYVPLKAGMIVREMCNKHGLWKAQS